jgi:preprotein translocase subunit YajC
MNNLSFFLLQGGGAFGFLFQMMPFILIFFVFYFLIIVPQRKRQRALQEMVSTLKPGDRVVTQGGIIATVTAVRDTSLLVRSAEKSILEVSRASVVGMHGEQESK